MIMMMMILVKMVAYHLHQETSSSTVSAKGKKQLPDLQSKRLGQV